MRTVAKMPPRRGLTVLELLVTIAIIGVLAALVLPAVGAARESARRVTCVNNMREMGLALHSHHNSHGHLPVGWQFDPSRTSAYGWAVPLLPYVGQPALHDAIDMNLPAGDPKNDSARETTLALMLCPSDIAETSFMLFEDDEDEDDDESAKLAFDSVADPKPIFASSNIQLRRDVWNI